MDEPILCRTTDLFEIWGWDDMESEDDADLVDEESEVEREPSIYERPEYKEARSRFLHLWDLAHDTVHYYKKDWTYLDGCLSTGEDFEEILQKAELYYELSQDPSWPSQFE